ncbi:MAG: dihydrofolate reductase [Candidatus Neomarinimicrobiota bacterium]
MKKYKLLFRLLPVVLIAACAGVMSSTSAPTGDQTTAQEEDFVWLTEKFADIYIVRYQIPGFDNLSLQQKKLAYYLYEAALSGREIIYDQNYKHNLLVKRTLEAIVDGYIGDRATPEWEQFMVYTKRVWFANGIHHHSSTDKIQPGFSVDYFAQLIAGTPAEPIPVEAGPTVNERVDFLKPILFDPTVAAKKVNTEPGADLLLTSATNYYDGVTQAEAEAYYAALRDPDDPTPVLHGLNSQLAKRDGELMERVWKVGGMYTEAVEKIVYWLEKASTVAENEKQKKALDLLIDYYKTGDLRTFDEYCIAWVQDTESRIDVVNGFIEFYADPLAHHGAFEAIVSIRDEEATKRIATISEYAQWFEENSPIMDEHKRDEVTGISAKVITVVVESGDASPNSMIGINLPNSNWIRSNHGSKSVTLGNIINGYTQATAGFGTGAEFTYSEEEKARSKQYGALSSNLNTDMHEVIGHASGRINPGVGESTVTVGAYANSIEETRADLVAKYYLLDPKLVEIGVAPSLETGKAQYESYIRNWMVQLTRIRPGDNIEQAHMRGRQAIPAWCYEKGLADNVIEKKVRDGKTYFVVNDHQKLRELFGQLLRELQRIKSEGDFAAARDFIETYGVKVDQELHAEVLERYAKLGVAPYGGFINPLLTPVEQDGEIVDVTVSYPDDFTAQMMYYARNYAFLPVHN